MKRVWSFSGAYLEIGWGEVLQGSMALQEQ